MKRATERTCGCIGELKISIHALVKRATVFRYRQGTQELYFNPRPREEGDSFKNPLPILPRYFNPRPREEGDAKYDNNKR